MLHLISQAGGISAREVTRRTRLSFAAATHVPHWLRGQQLIERIACEHHPGSSLKLTTTPGLEGELVRITHDELCAQLGAAVYSSRYADGELAVVTSASEPDAPPVVEGVPFPEVAHASALGKSLLAQLDFAGRMDHLARYKPRALTGRTITDPGQLFAELDVHGPHAGQFDLLPAATADTSRSADAGAPTRQPSSHGARGRYHCATDETRGHRQTGGGPALLSGHPSPRRWHTGTEPAAPRALTPDGAGDRGFGAGSPNLGATAAAQLPWMAASSLQEV
ncbi:IclR family transcriptional regulator C-terminal domain-containing protein [Streptomyces vinaceus]|uniref:IclR family transcriptional regulator domain-containing protein n=1 Tax=Streptomyces vinaceus TaxID=1960 RepID=UPI0035D716F0